MVRELQSELLKEYFYYKDGMLYNKITRGASKIDKKSGCLNKSDGYVYIRFKYIMYPEHRLIYNLLNGSVMGYHIDHINGIRNDNRIENLRLVTHRENMMNVTTAKGYCWSKEKKMWRAEIHLDGKGKHLGYFKQEEDARSAYLLAKKAIHTIKEKI